MIKDRVFSSRLLVDIDRKEHGSEVKRTSCDKFFRLSPDMLCILNFEGCFIDVNPSFESHLGFKKEELFSRPLADFIFSEDKQAIVEELSGLANTKTPLQFENRYVCKDGRVKWLSWKSVVLENEEQIYAVARDITSEKEAEINLKNQAKGLQELIDYKNEGLHYARFLQEALFHDPKTLDLTFKDSFILHSSKDILSGDFYWFERVNKKVFVACADCTGHGVAGAILSVLGINKLYEIITSGDFLPSQILDRLNYIIYRALDKKYGVKKMSDGMDVALFSIDFLSNTLDFSGAYNSLYIVRNNELIELQADKQSIGSSLEVGCFTNQTFQLMKGDMIYASTDGYPDQFGGEKGKKFTRKRFRDLLRTVAGENAANQKILLEKTLADWKNGHEQTDDICIIGIRI